MISMIDYSDFQKLELRTGKVESAEKVEGADKLLKLQVNIGDETRQLVAGIAEEYNAEEMVGKTIIVLTNLEPKSLRGVESQGMLLAAVEDSRPVLLTTEKEIQPGTKVS